MLRSTDAGLTWSTLSNTPNFLGQQGNYDIAVTVDPKSPNHLYCAGQTSLIQSSNGGASWTEIGGTNLPLSTGPHRDHHGLAFDAANRLWDVNDGGVWRLDDSATSKIRWTDLNTNLQITQFQGIAIDPTNRSIAYGGSQDNGIEKRAGSHIWDQRVFHDGGLCRVNRANPNMIYATIAYGTPEDGAFFKRSDDAGLTFHPKMNGINGRDRSNAYISFTLDPANPAHLYLATNKLYASANNGDNWSVLATPGLNGFNPAAAPIDSVSVSASGDSIYVATGAVDSSAAHLFVKQNGDPNWHQRDLPGVHDGLAVQADPANPNVAYAVRTNFNDSNNLGHVFQTTNAGLTWTNITSNLPDLPAHVLRIGKGNALYLGTDTGVYASNNLGDSWARLGHGLPNVQVPDMEFNSTLDLLAVGTHGRGMWEIALPAQHVAPPAAAPHASNSRAVLYPFPD